MSRKRWEHYDQALAALQLQAEVQSARKAPPVPANTELVAKNGVNHGPPPFSAMAKFGIKVSQ